MKTLSLDEHIFSQRLLSPSRTSDSGRPSCTMVKILPSLYEWLLLQCPILFVDITHAPKLHANPTLQCRLMKIRCPVRLHTSRLIPDSSPQTTTSVAAHGIVPQLAPSSRVNQYERAPRIQHLEKEFTATCTSARASRACLRSSSQLERFVLPISHLWAHNRDLDLDRLFHDPSDPYLRHTSSLLCDEFNYTQPVSGIWRSSLPTTLAMAKLYVS